MKTPQEEAEELLKPLRNQYQHTAIRYDFESKNGDEISAASTRASHLATRDALDIVKKIPHAELIAVARAAVEMLSDLQTFGSGDLDYEWEKALQALRATGKVEL